MIFFGSYLNKVWLIIEIAYNSKKGRAAGEKTFKKVLAILF